MNPTRVRAWVLSFSAVTASCKSPPATDQTSSAALTAVSSTAAAPIATVEALPTATLAAQPHSPQTLPPVRVPCSEHAPQTHVGGVEVPQNWVDAQLCGPGQGGWRIELHELTVAEEGVNACPKLVHTKADGSTTSRFLPHPMTVAGCRGQDCWAAKCETFALGYDSGLEVGVTHDWDDDDQSEAAVSAWVNLARGRSVDRVIVIDDDGKTLRHLPSTLSLTITDTRDVDNDGRPDFLLRFSSGVQNDEFGIVSADTLELAAHALPKGAISATDEQAKRYAATRCPEVKLDAVADEVTLLCAKLRGTPRAVALDAFRKNCQGNQLNACSTDAESTWDGFRPPFVLPPQ